MLLSNLPKAKEFDEEDFLVKLKEEVVDRFDLDFLKLHQELTAIKRTAKLEEVETLLVHNKEEQQHKTEEVQETIKTYEILIEDFKADLFSQIKQ